MKTPGKSLILAVAIVLGAAASLTAGDATSPNPFFASLSKATAAELPAKSAELVAQADAKACAKTAVNVVKAAVGLNPAAAPAIVGSIARQRPEAAAPAAGAAVALVPDQAVAIAQAAAAAAPSQAGKIVEAICRADSGAYRAVASAVAEVVPAASKDILKGVSAGVPALKDAINNALADFKGKIPPVSQVLAQASPLVPSTSTKDEPTLMSPLIHTGPPYVPPSPTPVNLNPGSGGQVPVGGRNYATP